MEILVNNETTTAVTAESVTASAPERSSWLKVIATSVLASLLVALVVLAFTWPTKT
ncbi:MAG: ABC transporter permease, partial [Rothia mucilaginosa]|nr:ABC transporter permease [Rothia mucilaginosa]